jgi:hypothetical protein
MAPANGSLKRTACPADAESLPAGAREKLHFCMVRPHYAALIGL